VPRRVDPHRRQALALTLLALLAACRADRVLIVTSDPPGAEVLLDGTGLGVTPVEHDFVHYGTRRLTLYLDGYLTSSEVIDMSPPWFGRFPLDLITEVLVPFGWRDEHTYHADLVPGRSRIADPDLRSVLRRAETLRTAGPEGPRGAGGAERRRPEQPVEQQPATEQPTGQQPAGEPEPSAPPESSAGAPTSEGAVPPAARGPRTPPEGPRA
jgi:hypothetical protein